MDVTIIPASRVKIQMAKKPGVGKKDEQRGAGTESLSRSKQAMPPMHAEIVDDLRASLRAVAWLNETLDAAASLLKGEATREMVLTLLILYKKGNVNGKRLTRTFAAWTATKVSHELEHSVEKALGQLLRTGLATADRKSDFQKAIGKVLELGGQSLKEIELSAQGKNRARAIRSLIGDRLDAIRGTLDKASQIEFDRMVRRTLPAPPATPKE
jgi:hypothetical protein